jgi:TctA family transporter
MEYFLILMAGVIYGFIIGLIPVAGATTGLIALYGVVGYFNDPYMLVVFTTAVVVTSSIGDSFSSIVMNIPGAGGASASMIDGFPMAQRGEATRALSAAISTSFVNGLIWGILVFLFLPYYTKLILFFGVKELFAFLIFATASVIFVSSRYYVRGFIALIAGVAVGQIGLDPTTAGERWTMGIEYLGDGIQLTPVLAGVLAFPELLSAYRKSAVRAFLDDSTIRQQMVQGWKDSWKYRWDGLRGGAIGAFVGLIPGVGGSIADYFAYSQTTVAANRRGETIGNGHVAGVIGCEGANNAQKATAYVPTVLFGIPGAPFEVIIMGLFMYVGLEMGTPSLLTDTRFFDALLSSYMWSLLIILPISFIFIRYAVKITNLPFRWYFWPICASLVWASVQYTGLIEDYIMLLVCIAAGLFLRHFKFSRVSFLIGFILSTRIEASYIQFTTLYDWSSLITTPVTAIFLIAAVVVAWWGIFVNKARIDFV